MFLQLYDIQGGLRIVKFAARVRPSTDNPVIVGYPAKERTQLFSQGELASLAFSHASILSTVDYNSLSAASE